MFTNIFSILVKLVFKAYEYDTSYPKSVAMDLRRSITVCSESAEDSVSGAFFVASEAASFIPISKPVSAIHMLKYCVNVIAGAAAVPLKLSGHLIAISFSSDRPASSA